MGVSELRELRQLREEKARLKRLVADLTLDKQILTGGVKKSFEAGETSGTNALDGQSLSGQRTESLRVRAVFPCRLVPKSRAPDPAALWRRIREVAHLRPRFGYLRIHVMLRREGWRINRKRVHRLFRLEGPAAPDAGATTQAQVSPSRRGSEGDTPTPTAEYGFPCTISCSMIVEPRFRFRGSDVADLLDRWVAAHGAPETITVRSSRQKRWKHGPEGLMRSLQEHEPSWVGKVK